MRVRSAVGVGVAVAGLLAGSLLSSASALPRRSAGVATASVHTTTLALGRSDFRRSINILATSPTWAAYEELAGGQSGEDFAGSTVALSDMAGRSRTIAVPARLLPPTHLDPWSLVGDMLTVVESSGRDASEPVSWWNVRTGAHGTATSPPGDFVIGSSPDGWVYIDGTLDPTQNQIFDQPAAGGPATSLGDPATADGSHTTLGLTGPDGWVALVQGPKGDWTAEFSPWRSTTITDLDLHATDPSFEDCDSEAFHALGCVVAHGDKFQVLRIPTSGAPAIRSHGLQEFPDDVSMTATTTGWVASPSQGTSLDPNFESSQSASLFTTPAKADAKITKSGYSTQIYGAGPFPFTATLGSGLGEFVVAAGPPRRTELATVTTAASTPKSLVASRRAAVHSSALSLNRGRLVYADDQHDFNGGDVFSRKLGRAASSPPGKASQVLSSHGISVALGSSVSTVAEVTIHGQGTSAHEVIHVIDGNHRTTVTGSSRPYFQVSGHHVLYTDESTGNARVLNAATGRSSSAVGAGYAVALTTRDVVYVKHDMTVWERPFTGHHAHLLMGVPPTAQFGDVFLTEGGGYVVGTWGYDEDDTTYLVAGYRRGDGKGPTRTFRLKASEQLNAATNAGLVVTLGTTVDVRRWTSGKTTALLPAGVAQQVSLTGHRVAWLDARGRIHIGTWR